MLQQAPPEFVDLTSQGSDRTARYLEAIRVLAPLVAEHRALFDQDRRLPQPVFDALADAGLFRLWLPKQLGGPELSPLEFMTVVEAAAALDGTVGWLVGNGAGMSRAGGYLPVSVAWEWFSHPRIFIVGATGAIGQAVPVDGGYTISGRWPFGSGAPNATHFMGLVATREEGRDQSPFCCYFEREHVTLHDNWHVSGLRGTASFDFDVRNLFVPIAQTHGFLDISPTQPGILYRLPAPSVFPWTVSVVPLGIARGALDSFIELAGRKSRSGTNAVLRDREIVQASFGRLNAAYRAARALLVDAMTELMTAMDVGGGRLVLARAEFRAACAHAAESALRIVDTLAADAGTSSLFESCALERAVRDVHAAVKHVAMSPNAYVVAGRVALGLDPGTSRF
jgi:alkylation response protein AidB-like acyl-CoA dehydrogenase